MNRKVLITGGAGYIGSHLCKRLAAEGWEPVTFDNLSTGNAWAVRWGPLCQGDLLDETALAEAFETHRPAAVMHLAALSSVAGSMQDPELYYRVNLQGTINLLAAMRRAEVRQVIFSSTASVYGAPQRTPIPEGHPLHPINPYGNSKLMAERLLFDFERSHGIASVSLRFFNAAGADGAGELGEQRSGETHLIPLALEVALGRRAALDLFGRDYRTPDGSCIRDYVHVEDIAAAHIRALDYLRRGGLGIALNLGSDAGFSVLEVIEGLRRITGAKIPLVERPRRAGDPDELVSDSSAAREILGWRPERSDLDSILGSAWAWAKSRSAAVS
ncbi:MAG: UDP-glucose 4-epimerase GalE [Rhodovibrionaceae bacterium]